MITNFNKLAVVALLLCLTGCNKAAYLNMGKEDDIAETAEKYIGSTDWARDKRKDDFGPGTWKCNKFVYNVLREAGVTAPTKGPDKHGRYWPLQAADWASSSFHIPGWQHMGYGVARQRGDVIAKESLSNNATGHCGIAVSSSQVVAAGKNEVSKGGHNLESGAGVRRYTGS